MEKWADVSQWQGLYDMAALKQQGYTGVLVRASHGHTQDPYYSANLGRARKARLRIGHYHYDENTTGEATFFISVVKRHWRLGDAYPVMDYETPPLNPQRAVEFTAEVASVFGGAGFYSSLSFLSPELPAVMKTRWLWVADYSVGEPIAPKPWSYWALWQKADTTNGRSLDLDVGNMAGAFSHPVVPPPSYLDIILGGKVVSRIRYGAGRVSHFLHSVAVLGWLKRGATLKRS